MSQEIREKAYKIISERHLWGTLALITLIDVLIGAAIGAVNSIDFFGLNFIFHLLSAAGIILVTGPLNYAYADISLNVLENKEIKVDNLFVGFKDFIRYFVTFIITGIFILLWSLLLIIPGIIKAISYSMTYFILRDDKSIEPDVARRKSIALMEGHKMDYFCLILSFIGWFILSIITAGILLFWVIPYFNTAKAVFYNRIVGKKTKEDTYNKINADELFEE